MHALKVEPGMSIFIVEVDQAQQNNASAENCFSPGALKNKFLVLTE